MDIIMTTQNFTSLVRRFDYVFFIKWVSTVILLVGVALTTRNVYPLNVYVSLVGNVGWLFVGIVWREWSLITVQTVIVLLYASGMVSNFLSI